MTNDGPAEGLSHLDEAGHARMVDVSDKDVTLREATARGRIEMQTSTLARIVEGTLPKGDVLATARIAGIMAAKRTHELIPLCHPLPISGVEVQLTPDHDASSVEIEATVRVTARTGVEMEALTAVSVAALTVYDMCKAVERGMRIGEIELVAKSGGRSGEYRAE
jgi:cyclic pyranopterin phosphate synthase